MKKNLLLIFALASVLGSCIKNDVPYPIVVPNVTSLTAEGALSVDINNDNRTVSIVLDEPYDITKVRIKSCEVDKKNVTFEPSVVGTHDFTEPKVFTLTTYQNYEWVISVNQPIERYFTVLGQVGPTYIDEVNHRVVVYVRESAKLDNITVTAMKLGPEQITTYSLEKEDMKDFSSGSMNVTITTKYGVEEEWHIFVDTTDSSVNITKYDPWTREAYVYADGIAGEDNGFRYRASGTSDWLTVPKSNIEQKGGDFTGHITGLNPLTEYECLAYSGSETSETIKFKTEEARQLPNHSFETVSKVTGKDYYKWYDPMALDPECRSIWWASGNGEGPDGYNGTATLGIVLTEPDSDAADGLLSARAQSSQLVGILACGNLFTGQFTEIIGTSAGAVHYGRPWTTRPRALRLCYKYQGGLVDCVDDYPPDDVVKKGDKDRFQIFVSVGDWNYKEYGGSPDSPVRVSTARTERATLFTPSSPGIIGFGNYVSSVDKSEWTELEIPLEYRSLERKPTHIIIICAVNYRGDYMTGCSSARLWLDNFRLEY